MFDSEGKDRLGKRSEEAITEGIVKFLVYEYDETGETALLATNITIEKNRSGVTF